MGEGAVSRNCSQPRSGSFPQMAGFASSFHARGTSSSEMTFPTLRSTAVAAYFAVHARAGNDARAENAVSCVWFDSLTNRSIKDISDGLTRRAVLIQG